MAFSDSAKALPHSVHRVFVVAFSQPGGLDGACSMGFRTPRFCPSGENFCAPVLDHLPGDPGTIFSYWIFPDLNRVSPLFGGHPDGNMNGAVWLRGLSSRPSRAA